ncbi:hypothetical protein B0H17DRAFT_1038682 [Mycena rosella]|uniref:Uncharacterized protein n=1 Tax=Mycena rosella TaxID=1033263 RepID=A0AAD7M7W0_MYCRO|nr:hypothetical protein B0H17DRAFT_1038682 [Mycena rosella]
MSHYKTTGGRIRMRSRVRGRCIRGTSSKDIHLLCCCNIFFCRISTISRHWSTPHSHSGRGFTESATPM